MASTKPAISPAPTRAKTETRQEGAKATPHVPTETPPKHGLALAGGQEMQKPSLMPAASNDSAKAASASAPVLQPSERGARATANAAWLSNVQVAGLWSINEDRNSWVYVGNTGWRKLSTRSPTGVIALTMISAHAYEKSSTGSLFEGDDGQISQLYIW